MQKQFNMSKFGIPVMPSMDENALLHSEDKPWWEQECPLLQSFNGAITKIPIAVEEKAVAMVQETLDKLSISIAKQDWDLMGVALNELNL